ncbi:MAG: hypothetical protein QXX68_01330 [Candidatus Pacearchaeota archaeon]
MAKTKRKTSEVKPDPVYLPVSLPRYKRNKILILKSMVSMIGCMRRIENIRNIKKEKARLIGELRKLLNFSHTETNTFDRDLPVLSDKSEMRKFRVTQRVSFEREFSYEEPTAGEYSLGISQKTDALDRELAEIKAALAKLNNQI